jgi:hypothetical protein
MILLLLVLAAAPTDRFEQARVAYERNDYKQVVSLVRPLLYPNIQLASQSEVQEAHRLLGIAWYKLHDEAAAEREFAILLENNPDFRLDRLVDGADVAQFVDRLRTRMEQELERARKLGAERAEAAERRRAREEEERRKNQPKVYVQVKVVEHPYALNNFPFGVGQWQNGQRGKALAFLGTEALFATTSFVLFLVRDFGYPSGQITSSNHGAASTIQTIQIATGGVFYGLWALGVADALKHYAPSTVTKSPLFPSPQAMTNGGGLMWSGSF